MARGEKRYGGRVMAPNLATWKLEIGRHNLAAAETRYR